MLGWLSKILCLIGAHHWDYPGGHCEECGECDEMFGLHYKCRNEKGEHWPFDDNDCEGTDDPDPGKRR